MLANWVKQATATTGTGTITLGSAETGFIAFGDAFADGDRVYYSIEDGNNREIGIGTYTASGTTLSRDTVLETLVSGTFDNTAPTAITLSGSAVVSVSAIRQTINGAYTSGWVRLTAAEWNIPDNVMWFVTSALFVANELHVFPAVLNTRHTVSKLVFEVNTADAATTHLRCGIYGNGSDGRPGDLIYDSGDLSSDAASTGMKTHTLSTPIELNAGHYWFGMVSDSTTLNISGIAYSSITGGNGGISRFSNERRRHPNNSSVTGALPSTFSISGNDDSTRPCFGWQ